MKPFKIQVKRIHFLCGKLNYESSWRDTAFRFDTEVEAHKYKRELDSARLKHLKYKVVENDVSNL